MHKIIFIINSLDLGGAETHLSQILPELKSKYNVSVCVMYAKGVLAQDLENKGIRVFGPLVKPTNLLPQKLFYWLTHSRLRIVVTLPNLLIAGIRLILLIRKQNPKFIHYFLPRAYIFGGICNFFTGQRIQIMSRRSLNNYHKRLPWVRILEKWLHRRMTLIAGNSMQVMRQLEFEGVSLNKLRLIYNGVESARFKRQCNKEKLRLQLNLPVNAVLLIMVANLFYYKGHADLLEALRLIQHKMPTWLLLCVGRDNGVLPDLRVKSAEYGLTNNVCWLGQRNDIADLLLAADIGLLCSHEEGFANAIIEGMAAGLPMIVTAVGGNVEAVVHNETGFIVPPHNPQALANAILKLASNKALQHSLGNKGRRRVARFNLAASVQAYADLYQQVE